MQQVQAQEHDEAEPWFQVWLSSVNHTDFLHREWLLLNSLYCNMWGVCVRQSDSFLHHKLTPCLRSAIPFTTTNYHHAGGAQYLSPPQTTTTSEKRNTFLHHKLPPCRRRFETGVGFQNKIEALAFHINITFGIYSVAGTKVFIY